MLVIVESEVLPIVSEGFVGSKIVDEDPSPFWRGEESKPLLLLLLPLGDAEDIDDDE